MSLDSPEIFDKMSLQLGNNVLQQIGWSLYLICVFFLNNIIN